MEILSNMVEIRNTYNTVFYNQLWEVIHVDFKAWNLELASDIVVMTGESRGLRSGLKGMGGLH